MISTGQCAGTPRQSVDTGPGVVWAAAFLAGAGPAGARCGASGARSAESLARWLVSAAAPPGCDGTDADCPVGAVPAGARRTVSSTRLRTPGSAP